MPEGSENTRRNADEIERAAIYRWEHPTGSWEDIAKAMGVNVRTIYDWRKTELWEIKYREIVERDRDVLLRAAREGMMVALRNGDGKLALEIYRAAGVMAHETINVRSTLEEPRNALKEFMDERSAHRLRSRDVAESPPDIP